MIPCARYTIEPLEYYRFLAFDTIVMSVKNLTTSSIGDNCTAQLFESIYQNISSKT